MHDKQLVWFVHHNDNDIRSTSIVFTCTWCQSFTAKIHRKINRISCKKWYCLSRRDNNCSYIAIVLHVEHVVFVCILTFLQSYNTPACNILRWTLPITILRTHHVVLDEWVCRCVCVWVCMCINAEVTSWSRRVTISIEIK